MPFTFIPLEIPKVVEVTPEVFTDERGAFAEIFKQSDFATQGIPFGVKQINQSKSKQGVIRGLHYQQAPQAQAKLVRVMAGEIFDVAVDIRPGSATYGKWVGVHLSANKGNMLFVPAGFAHGFGVVSAEADVVYYCSEEYAPEAESGIMWNDAHVGVKWPIETPILSEKDLHYAELEALSL